MQPIERSCHTCGEKLVRRDREKPSKFLIRRTCNTRCGSAAKGGGVADRAARFWARCDTSRGEVACWPWAKCKDTHGYGSLKWNRKNSIASRVAWALTFGEIPDGLHVLHRCDNPPCCNPKHLFLGTHQTNSDDKHAKGREVILRGESNGNARLTVSSVRDIRERYASGAISQADLARMYDVDAGTINSVVRRRNWRFVS